MITDATRNYSNMIDFMRDMKTCENREIVNEIINELTFRKPSTPDFDECENFSTFVCPMCEEEVTEQSDDNYEYTVTYCKNCGKAILLMNGD